MKNSLISVIIPTFNRDKTIGKAIDSVLSQSYAHLELIVIDDGSEDNTERVVASFEDDRLQTIRQNHSGVSAARNLGVKQSKGEHVAFLDSDDFWHEDKLKKQVQFHLDHPHIQISQTQEIWIRNGKRVNPKHKHLKPQGYIFPESLQLCTITPSSVLMSKKIFQECDGFDEYLPACEDYDLWLRITSKFEVGLIDDYLLTKYGGHRDQLSQAFVAMDRFRIYSLGKLLLLNELTEEQQLQVLNVLSEKITIFLEGARKRSNIFQSLKVFLLSLLNQKLSSEEFLSEGKTLLLSDHFSSS